MENTPALTVIEAAEYLGCSVTTIRRMEYAKIINPIESSGRLRRYTKQALDSSPIPHKKGRGIPHKRGSNESVDLALVGRDIIRIGNYIKSESKLRFKCTRDSCGAEWDALVFNVLVNNSGCPHCSEHKPVAYEEFLTRFRYGDKIELISEYKGVSVSAKWRCRTCGWEWWADPDRILKASQDTCGCSKCAGVAPKTIDEIEQKLAGRPIKLLGAYYGMDKYAEWMCTEKDCGHVWKAVSGNVVLSGTGCPACNPGGFNISKPSEIYVLKIGDEYCGYGIANNFKKRLSQHKANFKYYGVTYSVEAVFKTSGKKALDTEKAIKDTFNVVNTGIPGFKREATDVKNMPEVIKFITVCLYGDT